MNRQFIYYLFAVSFYFYDPILQTYPSVMTHSLMQEFGIGALLVGIIASSYYWSYNLIQIPCGIIADRFGAGIVLALAYLFCSLGLILFYLLPLYEGLILARFIMGLGGGCSTMLLVLISSQAGNRKYLPVLIGAGQLMGSLGAITGQMGFSFASRAIGWPHVILILAGFGFLMFFLSLILKVKSPMQPPSAPSTAGAFQAFLRMLKQPKNWIILLYVFFLWGAFAVFADLWGIPYLVKRLDLPVSTVSTYMIAAWIGSGGGSLAIGALAIHVKNKGYLLMLSALIGVLVTPLLVFEVPHSAFSLVGLLFCFGLASAGQALSFAVLLEQVDTRTAGAMTGLLNTAVMISPMILEPIVGGLVQFKGYHFAFPLLLLLFSLAFISAVLISRSNKDNPHAAYS